MSEEISATQQIKTKDGLRETAHNPMYILDNKRPKRKSGFCEKYLAGNNLSVNIISHFIIAII